MDYQEAWRLIGGLGEASKMPGATYGLPAKACKTGQQLAKIAGSPCSGCYALKGHYLYENVANAQTRRLASLSDPQWVEAFIVVLEKVGKRKPWFRWHDSGDIQSLDHLLKIFAIAYALPDMKFWLPTQERGILSLVFKLKIDIPDNLTIRVSAPMKNIREELQAFGLPTSSIQHPKKKRVQGPRYCPASSQGNACLDCRNCWDKKQKWIVYREH